MASWRVYGPRLSFQAPGFYARFGYRECGRTPAYPRGYDQIHLVKRLG
jgi:hypothetical protein